MCHFRSVRAEHDRVGFNRRFTIVVGKPISSRFLINFRLHICVLKINAGRFRRVDPERMFGQIPTIGCNKALVAWRSPEQPSHPDDTVHDVVIQWTATKSKPSGYCQRPVLRKAELGGGNLNR